MKKLAIVLCVALCVSGCIGPFPNAYERPRVLVFSAVWCSGCQRDKSALIQLEAMGVSVKVVDIDRNPELTKKYGVTSVPTYFIYVYGRSVQRTNDIAVVISNVRDALNGATKTTLP